MQIVVFDTVLKARWDKQAALDTNLLARMDFHSVVGTSFVFMLRQMTTDLAASNNTDLLSHSLCKSGVWEGRTGSSPGVSEGCSLSPVRLHSFLRL